MPELDFRGLDAASRAAFKPNFADVRRRASRRRYRIRAGGAVLALSTVAVAAAVLPGAAGDLSSGTPLSTVPATPAFIPPAGASDAAGGPTTGHHADTGAMVVGDLDHLYLRYYDCQGKDCSTMMASTADGGVSWTKSPLPVPHNAYVFFTAVAPRTVLAWVQENIGKLQQYWLASTDGGGSWHRVNIRSVDAIPAGWCPLDDAALGEAGVRAVNPATGEIVQLSQPGVLWAVRLTAALPPASGLWIIGYLGSTSSFLPSPDQSQHGAGGTGNTVDVSHDGGWTWHRTTYPEDLAIGGDLSKTAAVVSFDGQTAYAVGAAQGILVIYRTTDGGFTWQRTPVHEQVGDRRLHAAVRADGTLLIQAGDQAGDHPVMYVSTDEAQTIQQIQIGPGASANQVADGYGQSDWPNTSGAWVSPDGTTWSYVRAPSLP